MSSQESRKPDEPEAGAGAAGKASTEGRASAREEARAPAASAPGVAPGSAPGSDDEVPKLPRGKGLSLPVGELLRIAMFASLLVAVVVLRKPCSDSAGRFIQSFEPAADAGPKRVETPGYELPEGEYVRLSADMSEEEIQKKIEQLTDEHAGDAGVPADAGQAAPGARQGKEK